jgi:DNA-binding transcriptional regulator YiaG
MKITTDHSASSYNQPVILDNQGRVMDYAPGIRAIREFFGDTQQAFADRLGVSKKTVESWEYGQRMPSNTALRLLATML